jgi:hypothetical protein
VFELAAGEAVTASLFHDAGEGDLSLSLHSPTATLVTSATSADEESVTYLSTVGGTAFVRVVGASGGAETSYRLFASVGAPSPCGEDEDAFEPNDQRADATPLGVEPLDGFVCDRPDVFEVHATAGADIGAEVTFTAADGDLDVALYNSGGVLLDESSGTSGSEAVAAVDVPAGSYFVEVAGYEGAQGAFGLSVSGVDELGPAISGTVVGCGDGLEGIEVSLHAAAEEGSLGTVETAADGSFELSSYLAEGDYRLQLTDPTSPTPVWVGEWFDDAADHASAADLSVAAWDTATADVELVEHIPDAGLSDVSTSTPFYVDIWWMHLKGITTGSSFNPSGNVSRQAMSAFLYRMMGSPAFSPPGTATFSDVSTGHPFFAEIEWMAAAGISTGYPGSPKPSYQPSATVSRQAMAAFLYRMAGEEPGPLAGGAYPNPGFSDVSTGHTFYKQIAWMAYYEITDSSASSFNSSAPVSRQAMAAFLHRLAYAEDAWNPAAVTIPEATTCF